MKPAWFDYYAPNSLADALALLGETGADGRVLAGGQSLMPMLNCRLIHPKVLVDINRIAELEILHDAREYLEIGALVRHADLLRDGRVRDGWPLLYEATRQVAHPAIRNRGTVCGSIAHNDPAAEHPSVLVTLDGSVVLAGARGRRELPAEKFFTGLLSTAIEPGEMVVAVRYRRPPAGTGVAFVEFARRLGDFAIAGAAATLTMRDGVCREARLTVVGMGGGPWRARAAEAALAGRHIDRRQSAKIFAETAATIVHEIMPAEDVHASAAYRRHLAGVMAERALTQAFARTAGE